jgi:hypothetical protein
MNKRCQVRATLLDDIHVHPGKPWLPSFLYSVLLFLFIAKGA